MMLSSRYSMVALVGGAALATPCCLLAGDELTAEVAGQKASYTLFAPTPRALLRPLSTDRPDVTESPHTVDAGHVQFELSLFAYSHDREGDSHADAFAILPTNVKIGLTNDVDLQLVLDPYSYGRGHSRDGESERNSGFGDTQLRLKVNLLGNDNGPLALAIMPFIQFPTAADGLGSDRVEGGFILPLSVELPGEFSLGTMAEFDVVRDEADEGYGVEFVHTVNLNRTIVGDLAGYVEYVGISPIDTGGGYVAAFSFGFTYGIGDDVQLDAGATLGISDAAEDYTVFTGVSFRL